jgi:hypothetical protein
MEVEVFYSAKTVDEPIDSRPDGLPDFRLRLR